MKVRCNNCMAVFDEPEIIYNEKSNTEACPHCGKIGCLMDLTDEEAQSDENRLNELAASFDGIESRRKLIEEFGKSHTSYDINYAKALAKIRKFADPDIGERFNMQLDESFAAYAKNGYTAD